MNQQYMIVYCANRFNTVDILTILNDRQINNYAQRVHSANGRSVVEFECVPARSHKVFRQLQIFSGPLVAANEALNDYKPLLYNPQTAQRELNNLLTC